MRNVALALFSSAAFGAALVAASGDLRDSFACDLHDQTACARLEWRAVLAEVEHRKGVRHDQ
jgi:hypothetical protein